MTWNLVRLEDVAPAPWRNGGGVTRELLAWPGAGDWQVRMSVAEVTQDGPFSRFEGVQRWFAVLDGAGVRLRLDAQAHRLTQADEPFRFDGGAATDCELIDGQTQDFNLMLRGADGRMARVRGTHPARCRAGQLVAVYTGRDGAQLDGRQVPAGTLAWRILETASVLQVEARDALWMEITP
jgi:environmental stress-induced protein Ves